MIKLNETYSLDADKYQFILIERAPTAEGSKHAYSEQKTFHPSIEQVVTKIADIGLKSAVGDVEVKSMNEAIVRTTCKMIELAKSMEQSQ